MKSILLLVFGILFSLNPVFADTNDDLVAHYEFENTVEDSSPYNNDGVIRNNINCVNGIIGKAIMLNGSNKEDFIYLGHYDRFDADFKTGDISISAWLKGSSYFVFSCYNCTGMYNLHFVDGIVTFSYSNSWESDTKISITNPIDTQIFHHIVVTTEGNVFRIFINGIKVKEETHDEFRFAWCSSTEFNSSGVLINARGIKSNTNPPIPGWGPYDDQILYLDDLRIYKRHISDNEIIDLYEMGKDLNQNIIMGKIVTASEILGYTASVGGSTIKIIPHNLSTVTDIYGEFQLSNIPVGECILQIESSYFQTLTKTIQVNSGNNLIDAIEIFKPKCQNMYTQKEVDQLLDQMKAENNDIIAEKEATISQLNAAIASMYTQGYLEEAIIEAEKRGELKYDINNDGKVGLEEVIKYLETLSGVRIESLIIFPENKKHFLSE